MSSRLVVTFAMCLLPLVGCSATIEGVGSEDTAADALPDVADTAVSPETVIPDSGETAVPDTGTILPDSGVDTGTILPDSGVDTDPVDTGIDTGSPDSGSDSGIDTTPADTGAPDTTPVDSGTVDTGTVDTTPVVDTAPCVKKTCETYTPGKTLQCAGLLSDGCGGTFTCGGEGLACHSDPGVCKGGICVACGAVYGEIFQDCCTGKVCGSSVCIDLHATDRPESGEVCAPVGCGNAMGQVCCSGAMPGKPESFQWCRAGLAAKMVGVCRCY